MFLETCTSAFQTILQINEQDNIGFLLQLFECAVAEPIPKKLFDIKKMVDVWGDERGDVGMMLW